MDFYGDVLVELVFALGAALFVANAYALFRRSADARAAQGDAVARRRPGSPVRGYGQTVVVEHAGGVRTRYAHLSTTLVAPGEEVREGQVVGRAGHSGRATGTHLHFEVMTASGKPLNPEQFAGLKAEGLVADLARGTNHGFRP